MSVYRKLQAVRMELSKANLKKSGKNKFAGFEYFELGDFLPRVHEMMDAVGLCGVFNIHDGVVHLDIYDTEPNGGFVKFTSPLVMAENSKGQPIQSLGATHTYMRRYMWLIALELSEHDEVDATPQEGKRQITVTKVEKPKPEPINTPEGQTVLVDTMLEFAEICDSLVKLKSFWTANLPAIEEMKRDNQTEYLRLQTGFSKYKAKFEE